MFTGGRDQIAPNNDCRDTMQGTVCAQFPPPPSSKLLTPKRLPVFAYFLLKFNQTTKENLTEIDSLIEKNVLAKADSGIFNIF